MPMSFPHSLPVAKQPPVAALSPRFSSAEIASSCLVCRVDALGCWHPPLHSTPEAHSQLYSRCQMLTCVQGHRFSGPMEILQFHLIQYSQPTSLAPADLYLN